jgi:PAS domain S-box-containing protein
LQFTLEDITDIVQSKLQLHRVGQGLCNSSDYVWILDTNKEVVFRNKLAEDHFYNWQRSSLKRPDGFGQNFSDPLEVEQALLASQKIHEQRLQTQLLAAEGYKIDVDLKIAYQPNPNPSNDYWVVTAYDLRELNRTVRLQKQLIERFEAAMAGANDGLWEYDFLTQTAYFSDRWKTMLGFAPDEFPNSTAAWAKRIHPDDSEKVLRKLRDHYAGLTDEYSAEYRIKCKDGSYKRILARGKVQRGPSGDLRRFAGSQTDVDEMIRSLESSEYTQEQFRSIANLMPVVVWTLDPNGETEFVSDKWYQLLGIEPGDSRAADWRNFIPPENLSKAINQFDKMVISRESYEIEYQMVAANGRRIWIWEVGKPRFSAGGTFLGFVVVSVDITSEKLLLEKLERSEQQFRNVVEEAPFLFAILDENHSVIYFNSSFKNFLDPRVETPAPIENYLFPVDRELFQECIESVSASTPTQFKNIRFRRRDGAFRELLIGASLHETSENGKQYLLVGIDYESQRGAEAKVRRAERLLDLSQRVTKTGSLELDPSAGVSWCSSGALALLGITDRNHITSIQSIYDRLRPEHANQLQDLVRNTPDRGESDRMTCEVTATDGETRQILVTVTPIVLVPEHTERVLVTLQEVDSGDDADSENQAFKTAQSDSSKAEFLANIGYEIRSPINSIIGHISHLRPRTQKEIVTLENIIADAEQLDKLVTDMLLYAQLASDQQELDLRPFMVEETIEETCLYWSRKAYAKGLRSVFDSKLESDQMRVGDVNKICLILDQLLENAFTYTHNGFVMVTIEAEEGDEAISVSVEDSGVGMEPHILASMFEAMSHGAIASRPHASGSGLGLPIAHRTCEVLGGKLSIESEPGKGTVAKFTIPMVLAGTRKRQSPEEKELGKGLNIGVFDSLRQGGTATLRVFEFAGARGEVFTEAAPIDPFDLIVVQPEYLQQLNWEEKHPEAFVAVFANPDIAPQIPLSLSPEDVLQVKKPIRRSDQTEILKAFREFRAKSS